MALTRLDSTLKLTESFSQILCPSKLRTDPSSSWLFYKIAPNVKFFWYNWTIRHQRTVGVTLISTFFIYIMAIIHMESSRKPTNFTRDSFHKLSALSNYRRHLHKMALTCLDLTLIVTEFLSQILCKLESRRYPTIGVNQLSASLTQNGAWPLGLNYEIIRIPSRKFSEIIESAITNYRRYSTIGVTQLSASLTKDGVYSLGLSSGIDRIFLANSLPIKAPYGSFKLLIILQNHS